MIGDLGVKSGTTFLRELDSLAEKGKRGIFYGSASMEVEGDLRLLYRGTKMADALYAISCICVIQLLGLSIFVL